MLCGNFCVNYIIEKIEPTKVKPLPDMIWTTDLASAFLGLNINNVEIYFHNSKLVEDYLKADNYLFDGFKSIENYLAKGGSLVEKKFTEESLLNELALTKFMILCVKSRILNNNSKMTGGHFVVLQKENKDIKMINPLKVGYEERIVTPKEVMNLCKDFGNWRILIY